MVTAVYLLVQNTATAANTMTASAKNLVLKHVKRMGRRMVQAGVVEAPSLPDYPAELRNQYPDKYNMVFSLANPIAHPFGMALAIYAHNIKMMICDSPWVLRSCLPVRLAIGWVRIWLRILRI